MARGPEIVGRAAAALRRVPKLARSRRTPISRLLGLGRIAWLTYRADDSHSYLMAQAMTRIADAYDINVRLLVVDVPERRDRPEPYFYSEEAMRDCVACAPLYGCSFPTNPSVPDESLVNLVHAAIATAQSQGNALQTAVDFGASVWNNDLRGLQPQLIGLGVNETTESIAQTAIDAQTFRMHTRGYFESGAVCYGGEWYKGVDRLWHLIHRLSDEEDQLPPASLAHLAARDPWVSMQSHVRRQPTAGESIEFFFTFRCAYSYLALARITSDATFSREQTQIQLKPMLPSRSDQFGFSRLKIRYLREDARREAERHGIPFERFRTMSDEAMDHCLSVLFVLRERGLALEWVKAVMCATWVDGIDLSSRAAVLDLARRSSLAVDDREIDAWPSHRYELECESNRRDLASSRLWGEPSIRRGELAVWGQDRVSLVLHSGGGEPPNQRR